jgi:hypothetical protein
MCLQLPAAYRNACSHVVCATAAIANRVPYKHDPSLAKRVQKRLTWLSDCRSERHVYRLNGELFDFYGNGTTE